jgi:putative spermidine/putrescine transport system permease protein
MIGTTRRRLSWRHLVLSLAGIFFAFPFFAMARFAFQNVQVFDLGRSTLFEGWSLSVLTNAFHEDYFWEALRLSLKLSVGTAVLTLVILVPTAVWVHLKVPKARAAIEFLTVLPYVIPAIALVAGIVVIKPHARWFLNSDLSLIPFYVILALPFTYRSIDAGLRALDLRTLTEAARSLGAGWNTTLLRVLLPSLKSALVSSTFLTIAVVLGEYTIADVLLKRTLPAFMAEYRQSDPRGGYALAVISLLVTTVLFAGIGIATRPRGRGSHAPSNTSTRQEMK